MNKTAEELILRKQVLIAKSDLHRLQVQRGVQGIANSLGWIGTGAKVASSLSLRTGLLGLVVQRVTGSPLGQAAALTGGLLLLSKIATAGFRMIRSSAQPPASTPE
jgi:hypothetical protein